MIKEFKTFILRGNALDLAVGVIIGAAFNAVVQSLANDVLMNTISGIFGQPDFSELFWSWGQTSIRYGAFLTALVNFVLVATVLFFLVKLANRLVRPDDAPDEPPTARSCPYCLTAISVMASRCPACTAEVTPAQAQ